jgi:ATP-dependent DNA helicase RecG
MQAIVATNDGFALAEADLALRGAGQLFGERQSGLPELKVASLSEDVELIRTARRDAEEIITADPTLGAAIHRPLESEVRRRFGAAWKWVSSG